MADLVPESGQYAYSIHRDISRLGIIQGLQRSLGGVWISLDACILISCSWLVNLCCWWIRIIFVETLHFSEFVSTRQTILHCVKNWIEFEQSSKKMKRSKKKKYSLAIVILLG